MTESTEDKLKDIGEITDELLNQLEEEFENLLRSIEDYSIAKDGATIKQIDENFKKSKEVSKKLNHYSKEYRKFIIDEAKEHGVQAQKEM